MGSEPVKIAINAYFSSEAAEMYCIVAGATVLGACSVILWLKFSDRFSFALCWSLAVIALLLAATGVSLLIRDGQNHQSLIKIIDSGEPELIESVVGAEQQRMKKVADNYQNLRYMFASFALIAALLVAFTHHHVSHAIAVALLVFAMAGLVIDRYSEVRARTYLSEL